MSESEYFEVVAGDTGWLVSRRMVQAIEAELQLPSPPAWLTFVDLSGARVRLAARALDSITQSSPEIRATRRSYRTTCHLEEDPEERGEH